MDIRGAVRIPASPELVWQSMTDPGVLAQCVAGCDSLEQTGTGTYSATGAVKLGPVRSRIAVTIRFAECAPPHQAKLHMHADGKMGTADATATIVLSKSDGGTALNYDAQAALGGQLGRFAGHWGQSAAQQLVSDFFQRFAAAVPKETTGTEIPPAAPPPPPPPREPAATPPSRKALWIGLGAGAGAILAATATFLLTRNRTR